MPENDEEFLKRLRATFQVEAEEHVSALSSGLLELEKASPEERNAIIETVFRGAHSLKGAARSVNMTQVEAVCQKMEGVFAGLKRKEIVLSPELLDELHKNLDALRTLVSPAETKPVIKAKPESSPAPPAVEEPSPKAPASSATPSAREETVRVSSARLDSLVRQAEELVSVKLAANQHAEAMRGIHSIFARWKKEWSKVHPDLRAMERASGQKTNGNLEPKKLLEFLEWNETHMQSLQETFSAMEKPFERDRRALALMVDGLLDDLKKTAMLPFSSLLVLLRKLVRDLSREQGKLIDLVVTGDELEMDRRILEDLKDPLIHLVRNSIDHGIKKPEERQKINKPPRGRISIAVLQRDSKVEIQVADDGSGIDAGRVRKSAVKCGAISELDAEKLSDAEAVMLIFRSGVSTSPMLTNISGRGLGLAIVREKVEQLGGTVWIENRVNAGTTFHMLLPLTLSTFRGVILQVADRLFVLPTNHVERVVRVRKEEIKTVENRETLSLDGQTIPLVGMADVLGLAKPVSQTGETITALVISSAGQRIAFRVDEIRREQEVVLKNLGKQLARVRNISGATILGGGGVVPVLNVTDLMKSAAQASPVAPTIPAPRVKKSARAILVADDSITSRSLLKNILETNGYKVETAVDGIDAFTKLRSGDFGLVVSDVEMPRMDGFDLTSKIRADKKFAEIPVVLVTALESREHRERGIDVGANAYIVKSSFDQSNLLEAVQRLI